MKKEVFILVFVLLTLQTLAVREPSEYAGSCKHGTKRCAGAIIQECINRQWFVKSTCQKGTICDDATKTCKAQKKVLAKPSFSVRKTPECRDGESRCEQAHVFLYCSNGFWQKEQCKTGFRCDIKKRGCAPFRPYAGLTTIKVASQQKVTIIPGKSKFQPATILRHTRLPSRAPSIFARSTDASLLRANEK